MKLTFRSRVYQVALLGHAAWMHIQAKISYVCNRNFILFKVSISFVGLKNTRKTEKFSGKYYFFPSFFQKVSGSFVSLSNTCKPKSLLVLSLVDAKVEL
jgi:hypothetical protein